jgi:predicted MFS family arabinose efflux permease
MRKGKTRGMETKQTTPGLPTSLWRNSQYLLLWGGQVISSIGTQVSQLAFPLLVLLLTHSAAQAGFVGALRIVPYLLFSLPAGALLDRWDRKRAMIVCDAIRALCLASIPFAYVTGSLSLLQIYLVSLLEGTLYVVFDIAEAACLPNVVESAQLPEATAMNQATQGITSLLGPPLGGFLYGVSTLLPFGADAVSYLVSVLSLFWIKRRFQQERTTVPRRLDREVIEGLAWFGHHSLLRVMAVLSCGINLVVVGGSSLVVIVLAQHLHASPFLIGLIFAGGGVGSILGAVLAPLVQKRLSFGQAIIGSTWLLALIFPLYALAQSVLVLFILTPVLFFLGPIYNVVNASYRLAIVPDALQGRVNSAVRLISFASQPLGLAVTGVLLQGAGPSATVLMGAGVLLLVAGVATGSNPVRNAPRIAHQAR